MLTWFDQNGRDLPWRLSKDPYVIWLSEIILQQTRIAQGTPYFLEFYERFPTVVDFANADLDEILRMWQGLGYYSRACNMYSAAQQVITDFGGVFPTEYKELLTLKGVGEYTAAAISSIAGGECRAVLDGNVFRVLSRYLGIETPINSTSGKKEFTEIANQLMDCRRPGDYNQAIMDFGSMQCKPSSPDCQVCILQESCVAFRQDVIADLPVKLKKKPSRNRYFHYFLIHQNNEVLMSQRGVGDVWAKLYEFPNLETEEDLILPELMEHSEFKMWFDMPELVQVGPSIKHVLSHQNIYAKFYRVKQSESLKLKKSNWNYFISEKLDKLAKHKLIFSFLENNNILS